jgi:hypothetical protein
MLQPSNIAVCYPQCNRCTAVPFIASSGSEPSARASRPVLPHAACVGSHG